MNLDILKIASDTNNNKSIKNYTHHSKLKNSMSGDKKQIDLVIKKNKIVGITGLDTRSLTNFIRDKGAPKGTISYSKNGKFNVYLMDRVRALAGAESQNIEIIFVSHDGETASILGNAFAEDLGFKNVYVLDGGIKAWISEEKALVSFLK